MHLRNEKLKWLDRYSSPTQVAVVHERTFTEKHEELVLQQHPIRQDLIAEFDETIGSLTVIERLGFKYAAGSVLHNEEWPNFSDQLGKGSVRGVLWTREDPGWRLKHLL